MKLSSELLKAVKASATVAEMGKDLKAGLPRQRSDITTCDNKLTAMQILATDIENFSLFCKTKLSKREIEVVVLCGGDEFVFVMREVLDLNKRGGKREKATCVQNVGTSKVPKK